MYPKDVDDREFTDPDADICECGAGPLEDCTPECDCQSCIRKRIAESFNRLFILPPKDAA